MKIKQQHSRKINEQIDQHLRKHHREDQKALMLKLYGVRRVHNLQNNADTSLALKLALSELHMVDGWSIHRINNIYCISAYLGSITVPEHAYGKYFYN